MVDREGRAPSALDLPLHPSMPSPSVHDDHSSALSAEALLREHPDALVCGLSSNGLIVPIPGTMALWGQEVVEGRAVIDLVIAADRNLVVDLWQRVHLEGSVEGKVRLLSKPSRWMTLRFLDLREAYDVLLCVILPGDEVSGDDAAVAVELPPAAPRFATLIEDELGKVLGCDEAFTQMFEYTAEDLIGNSVLDQIHDEDQGRVVEAWLAMVATHRNQQTRLRRKRKDGSWMWVDTTVHNFLNEPGRNHVLVEIIDVSAEMAAQDALQQQGELLRRLIDAIPDGLLQQDTERNVVYHNARLLQILHTTSGAEPEAPGDAGFLAAAGTHEQSSSNSLLSTLTPEATMVFEAALGEVLATGNDEDVEVDFVLDDGTQRRALMGIRALLRRGGEVSGAITSILDVTDSAQVRAELERRATFDALTSAHNRSSILASLSRELARADPRITGVIYVDLDGFKDVNDSLGHAAGDQLLVLVAERLRELSRDGDQLGRLGGDEFLMLLRDISDTDAAMRVARRISEALGDALELTSGPVTLRASMGVACTGAASVTAEELVERADAAMYLSKKGHDGLPVLHKAGWA
jgi:diguanylate cyclase (GGDEF)-like protein/PAS domain S-box-containing protein